MTDIALGFVALFVIVLVNKNADDSNAIQYFEKPMSYENEQESSFKVIQVLGMVALASEISNLHSAPHRHFSLTQTVAWQ